MKIKQIKKQSAVCCAIIMIWGQFLCRWKRRKYCRKTTEEEKACSRQKIWHLNLQRHILVNGCYYHFEFESDSISESDLRRFREYEAATVRTYNAPVVTFVICSSKVKVLRDRIVDGINTYRVHLIRLKDEDADKVLDRIRENGAGCLSREDIIPLLFSPLMGGRSEQKDRILQGIRILKSGERIFPEEDVSRMEAILYAFAVKFLNEKEIELIKEEMAMTILGQMIWDDAMEKGVEKGREEGSREASERYSRLILILSKENKTDLLVRSASDPEYREELFKEYGI